jgi:hypothetical protein
MSVYYFHVAMNRVMVKTPAAVRDILRRYDTRPPLDVASSDLEAGTLVLEAEEYLPDNEWPSAVRRDELPGEFDGDDEQVDGWLEAASDLHDAKGERG